MAGVDWKLEEGLQAVTVTFTTDPVVQLELKVSDVEAILEILGKFRPSMKPEVPRKFRTGQKTEAILNPVWVTEPERLLGDSVLHVRDPRYGWLHYLIPRRQARMLGQLLQRQADAPPPAPPRENLS